RFAMEYVAQADVILALGTRLNMTGIMPQYDLDFWPRSATLIMNDNNPLALGADTPFDVGLVGDCAETARALETELTSRSAPVKSSEETLAEIREGKSQWWDQLHNEAGSAQTPLSPKLALKKIAEMTPEDAIVTADAGNATSFVTTYFQFTQGRSLMMPGTFGSMGGAFSNAIGAKISSPDRPVIAISGDGAWGTGLQE
ncbi:hypothetical protein QT23_00300, partial [Staphylococcus aureus]